MRKNLKKLALPAIAAAGAVMGSFHSASATIIVTITETATNSGGFDVYTMNVINNGANSTGTKLNAINMKLNLTSAGFIKMDNTKVVDGNGAGDTAPDINLLGVSDTFGSTIGTYESGFGSSVGLAGDFENHIADSGGTWSAYNNSTNGGPNAYNTIYDSLTGLEIDLTLNTSGGGTAATVAKNFANIVVPHGVSFTVAGAVGAPIFASKAVASVNYLFTEPSSVTPSGPIVLLAAAGPTNTGGQIKNGLGTNGSPANPLGNYNPSGAATSTLTVTNTGVGGYLPGYINGLTSGTNAGWTATGGFSAADLEIYLLNLQVGGGAPTSAEESQLASDINADNTGVVASLVTNPNLTNLGGIAWSIELNFASPANPNGDLGFNFAGETNLGGAVTVTDIAAIPEPATAGLLMVGGLGLLARRRRSAK